MKLPVKSLGLTVLAATVLCTQLSAQPDQTTSLREDPASIQGRVYDASSKRPLANVKILLFTSGSGGIKATRTDERGAFAFDPIEPATYKLTADKNGYAHCEYRAPEPDSEPAELVIAAGQHLKDLVFLLESAAVITGRVVDEHGEPLKKARVTLNVPNYSRQRRVFYPRGSENTNDLGEYRLHNIQPGRYFLTVDYDDDLLTDPGVEYAAALEGNYARVYYPGVLDSRESSAIELGAGEVRRVDFQLRRVKSVGVLGTVRVLGETGPEKIHVELLPNWDLLARHFRARDAEADPTTGEFRFENVPPGDYILRCWEMVDDVHLFAYRQIEVNEQHIEKSDLVLAPGVTVVGQVRLDGHTPDERFFENHSLRVHLTGGWNVPGNNSADVEQTGKFEIVDAAAMTYRVTASGLPPDAYLKRAALGQQELPQREIKLEPGAKVDGLQLFVSLGGGRLDGVVLDRLQQPASDARVVAMPTEGTPHRPHLVKAVETDQLGRYTIRGLTPGRYRLAAFKNVEPGVYYLPEFLERHGREGIVIEVEEHSRQEFVLETREISGREL